MYSVDIENESGYRFIVKSKEYQFVVDSKGEGIAPMATLLASLGSCIGVYIRKYAEGAKLDINNFKVSLEAELSEEKPVSFRKIYVKLDLGDTKLEDKRKRSLLQFIRNCPVHNTLMMHPEIEVSV